MITCKIKWWTIICILFIQNIAKAQFIGSETDSSMSLLEMRKGTVAEFSLAADANPGEEFRWEVTAGKITTSGAVGNGTIDNPSVFEFKEDMHTIEIEWQTDDSSSVFFIGNVLVQKKSVDGCASVITKQTVKLWSMPTASIDKNNTDYSICSGELVGGYIIVNLTGASDFTFSYSIKSNGLSNENGDAINTEHHTITTSYDTAHIMLPASLINPSQAASKYYTIELTAMNDDFLGNGEIVQGRNDFTITVFPSVKIDSIKSTKLNRR